MNIGEAVKVLRKKRGVTQQELAERSGVTQGFLSLVERGERKPAITFIDQVSRALKVPPQLILLLACEQHPRARRYARPLRRITSALDELLRVYAPSA